MVWGYVLVRRGDCCEIDHDGVPIQTIAYDGVPRGLWLPAPMSVPSAGKRRSPRPLRRHLCRVLARGTLLFGWLVFLLFLVVFLVCALLNFSRTTPPYPTHVHMCICTHHQRTHTPSPTRTHTSICTHTHTCRFFPVAERACVRLHTILYISVLAWAWSLVLGVSYDKRLHVWSIRCRGSRQGPPLDIYVQRGVEGN
jgi:hypothetical protein